MLLAAYVVITHFALTASRAATMLLVAAIIAGCWTCKLLVQLTPLLIQLWSSNYDYAVPHCLFAALIYLLPNCWFDCHCLAGTVLWLVVAAIRRVLAWFLDLRFRFARWRVGSRSLTAFALRRARCPLSQLTGLVLVSALALAIVSASLDYQFSLIH